MGRLLNSQIRYKKQIILVLFWSHDQTLNHTGFRKICKKHDKILVRSTGSDFMSDVIGQAAFWTDKNLKRIINGLEEMMAGLEGGDMKKAMERLRRVLIMMLQSDRSIVSIIQY